MRKILMLAAVGVLFSGLGLLRADDKDKKVTIKGEALCAKCALKEEKKCQNVVTETKDGKKTKYYLVDATKKDFSKKAHQSLGICTASKDSPVKVEVTGTVEKKDGKMLLTPTEKIKALEE